MEMRLREASHNIMDHIPSDHSTHSLEAAKNLVVSEHKMTAFKQELDTRTVFTGIINRYLHSSQIRER